MNKRFFSTLAIFILILVAPYWLYLPALYAAVIFFPLYWEGLIMAFVIDVLYGANSHEIINFSYTYAWSVLLILLISLPIKGRLRINA